VVADGVRHAPRLGTHHLARPHRPDTVPHHLAVLGYLRIRGAGVLLTDRDMQRLQWQIDVLAWLLAEQKAGTQPLLHPEPFG
jgi:hypothetical protein